MLSSLEHRLQEILERHEQIGLELGDPEIISNQDRFRRLSQEYARLEPVTATYARLKKAKANIQAAEEMLDDADLAEMAREELDAAQATLEEAEAELTLHLIPRDPLDDHNIFLEIRAGTGGDEAAIFSGDLLNMYARYIESKGWKLEILSDSEGEHGGYKEVICRVQGHGAYSQLKFESGTHRVQRVPETESQGRIHTSACTVAVLPELDEIEAIDISPADLRIDTYRASGAGGQHVNKTDSAIRITHLPTGMVVECQDERSQHKNRARAMSLLQARLLDEQRSAQTAKQASDRKLQVGSGDRSERIRTYNFPQNRVTDHRIGLTLHKLTEILSGELDQVIQPLLQEDQSARIAALSDSNQ